VAVHAGALEQAAIVDEQALGPGLRVVRIALHDPERLQWGVDDLRLAREQVARARKEAQGRQGHRDSPLPRSGRHGGKDRPHGAVLTGR
jgi:hypothetical protein